ncbi:cyclin-A3-1-like [Canna indica]|uniref:Cyclin-A3-1-like n=1 Tax=Canna indica TaxID=4628 RepID=A0AAQ3K5V1_9LILI|nr:cyclin-A3-1-like [Canna indica]
MHLGETYPNLRSGRRNAGGTRGKKRDPARAHSLRPRRAKSKSLNPKISQIRNPKRSLPISNFRKRAESDREPQSPPLSLSLSLSLSALKYLISALNRSNLRIEPLRKKWRTLFPPSHLHSPPIETPFPSPPSLAILLSIPPPPYPSLRKLRRESARGGSESMADKENCVPRLTRAAAKRAASAAVADARAPSKRKRVALSDLPTLANTAHPAVDLCTPPPSKLKSQARKKVAVLDDEKVASVVESADSSDTDSDVDDPQLCAHYASDIYQYLRSMEVDPKRRPLAGYMEKIQTDATANMRAILVDWLVEVAEEYKLVSDTFYLTISYIDRYLSFNPINRQRLQLLGVSAMLIASKYEEITPPNVEDFCYITDNTYTKQEVVKMESDILNFLKFEMGNPTVKTFIRRFTQAGQDDEHPALPLDFLASYLSELSLLDYGCVHFVPSVVAASAVFVARFTIDPKIQPWNKKLAEHTGYKASDLKDCIQALLDLQLSRKASNLVAIREKYKQHRFKCVSALVPPAEIPAIYFNDLK